VREKRQRSSPDAESVGVNQWRKELPMDLSRGSTWSLAAFVALAVGGGVSRGAADEPLGEPKKSIAHQLELLKAGEVEKLRACFTERQRERITKEAVEKGKQQAGKYTLNDLVASVEMGEFQGKKTAKIKMKNGRSLTTLILTDGKWLSDTVWFK